VLINEEFSVVLPLKIKYSRTWARALPLNPQLDDYYFTDKAKISRFDIKVLFGPDVQDRDP